MTNYKCGHSMDIVIMNESIMGLVFYLHWKDSVGFDGDKSLCFNCACKKDEERIAKDKLEHPENWKGLDEVKKK